MLEEDTATEIVTTSSPSMEKEGLQEEMILEEGSNGNTQESASAVELQAQAHRDVKEIAAAIISRKETIVQSFLEIAAVLSVLTGFIFS